MNGVRGAGAAVVAAVAVALCCLAGSAAPAHAAPQAAAALPVAATTLATGVLQTVIGGFKDEAISAGFAGLLGFIGLGEEEGATKEQVSELQAQVGRVEDALRQANETLNATKVQVDAARVDIAKIKDTTLQSAYSQAAQKALEIVQRIDIALGKISAANNARLETPGPRRERTQNDAENYVSEYIDGAAESLRDYVFGDPRGVGGTPLIQAAFAVAAGDDVLTPAESVHIRYLVDLYTTYESLAAAITGEYRRSRAGYSEAQVKTYLNNWLTTVRDQLNGRREAVPEHTVVDTRTLRMWSTALTSTTSPAAHPRVGGPAPYTDWSIPSIAAYSSLIAGYATTPKEFLANRGFAVSTPGSPNVLISSDKKDYTACRPGFASIDMAVNPPTIGVLYGRDLGGCNPGTHGGATTYQVCRNKPKAGRGGGSIRVCSTLTDDQQVVYNARKFGDRPSLFYAVRTVAVGAFLPASYRGA